MGPFESGGRRPFNNRTESIGDWAQLHVREIAIGAVAVVAVGVGIVLYQRTAAGTAQRAEQAYYAAQQAGQASDPAAADSALARVIANYDGTAAGTQAAMHLAQLRYDAGKHAEGLAVLSRVEAGARAEFAPGLRALTAAGYEGQGNFAEAAAAYREAAEAARFDELKDRYRSDAARTLALTGDTDGAVEIWQELADDPTSPLAAEARVRLGELTAVPAGRS